MNQQAFESGKAAYQSGDWFGTVTKLSAAKQPGEPAGAVDHLIGNAYMKLGQFAQAANAYQAALTDRSYGKRGALCCNRGRALLAAGNVNDAIVALTEAVQDNTYATPYKAYLALGSAYEKAGDIRNAGTAYRNAAIDESNPSPSGALSSLGSCFMRLGRPVDAVEAYRTALDFTTPLESQSQIYSDLAMAYVAANRMSEAVDAFAHATADPAFRLTPEAQASYDAARRALASVSASRPSETDAFLEAAGYGNGFTDPLDPAGASGELIPSAEDTGFFSVTEADLMAQDLQDRKAKRKQRHTGLKVFIVILILLIAVVGSGIFAYTQGYGWPTQESVVASVFEAANNGSDIAPYVSSSATGQLQSMSDSLVKGSTPEVKGIDRSMTESTVYVTAKLSQGGEQDYTIKMVRDGISWKLVSLETTYTSQTSNE